MSEEASINQQIKSKNRRITHGAKLLIVGGALSKILGLFRDLAMAQMFSRDLSDAWVLAFRVPHFLRRLFSEGAVAGGVIPLLRQIGWGAAIKGFLISSLCWLAVVVGSILLLPPGESHAVAIYRAMGVYIWCLWPIAYLSALALAQQRHILVAVVPVLFNALVLWGFYSFNHWLWQLGWALSIAGAVQLLMLMSVLQEAYIKAKQEKPLAAESSLWSSGFWQKIFISLGNIGFHSWLGLVATIFAASLGEGVLSYFFWAERLLEFPLSLLGGSLSLVTIAGVTSVAAQGDSRIRQQDKAISAMHAYLQQSMLWILPAVLGLYFYSSNIVHLLFGSERFSSREVLHLTETVRLNAVILLFISWLKVINTILVAQGFEQKNRSVIAALLVFVLGALMLKALKIWNIEVLLTWMIVVSGAMALIKTVTLFNQWKEFFSCKKAELFFWLLLSLSYGAWLLYSSSYFDASKIVSALGVGISGALYLAFYWALKALMRKVR